MKYLVMECHLSYAVVLDEEGNFHKAANLGYEVGQRVENVMLMLPPQRRIRSASRIATHTLGALCACLIAAFCIGWFCTAANVYVSINPDLRIDVNYFFRVCHVEPLNADAVVLLENYDMRYAQPQETVAHILRLSNEEGYFSDTQDVHIHIESRLNRYRDKIGSVVMQVVENFAQMQEDEDVSYHMDEEPLLAWEIVIPEPEMPASTLAPQQSSGGQSVYTDNDDDDRNNDSNDDRNTDNDDDRDDDNDDWDTDNDDDNWDDDD